MSHEVTNMGDGVEMDNGGSETKSDYNGVEVEMGVEEVLERGGKDRGKTNGEDSSSGSDENGSK